MTISIDRDAYQDTKTSAEELPLRITHERRPFGYQIYPIKPFAIVSKSAGMLGYLTDMESALPWLRILARRAMWKDRPFDFRLYRWRADQATWEVALDAVEL